MTEVRRPDLHERLTEQLTLAVKHRDSTAHARATADQEPESLIVCLGSGRCLFPTVGDDERVCAFCLRVPQGYDVAKRVPQIVHNFVEGN